MPYTTIGLFDSTGKAVDFEWASEIKRTPVGVIKSYLRIGTPHRVRFDLLQKKTLITHAYTGKVLAVLPYYGCTSVHVPFEAVTPVGTPDQLQLQIEAIALEYYKENQ